MLTVNQPRKMSGLFINDKGNVEVYKMIVDYYINAVDYDDSALWTKVFGDLESSVLVMRGFSQYEVFTDQQLKTNNFTIQYNQNVMNPWVLDVPCFGSPRECIELNLKTYASVFMAQQRIQQLSVVVKVRDDDGSLDIPTAEDRHSIYFNLIVCSDSGLSCQKYRLNYSFTSDRNPTCGTCIAGLDALKVNLMQLGTSPIDIYGNIHSVEGQIVTDVDISNDVKVMDLITMTLAPTIALAKVTDLVLERI